MRFVPQDIYNQQRGFTELGGLPLTSLTSTSSEYEDSRLK